MKNVLLFCLLLFVGMISCTKESDVIDETVKESSPNFQLFENFNSSIGGPADVGLLHNEILSEVYDSLEVYMPTVASIANEDTLEARLIKYSEKIVINRLYDVLDGELTKSQIKEFISDMADLDLNFTPGSTEYNIYNAASDIIDLAGNIPIDTFNYRVNNYLNNLSSVITSDSVAIVSIYMIAETAKNSFAYWQANDENWLSLFGHVVMRAPRPGYKGRVLTADVEGAAQGALVGFLTGGVGALIGGVLGGPVSSSWQGIKEYMQGR